MSWSHLMKAHDASLSANHDKTNNDKNEDLKIELSRYFLF